MKSYKPANKLTGYIIRSLDGSPLFRVYDKKYPEGFVDYELHHNDIKVTLEDEDAFVYNDEYIDYSKETLGNED